MNDDSTINVVLRIAVGCRDMSILGIPMGPIVMGIAKLVWEGIKTPHFSICPQQVADQTLLMDSCFA